jgi:uncharacterized cupin superfamily protein
VHDHVSDQVGTELLFENDRVRVWSLTLQPGQASPRHRHEHDYLFVHTTPATIEYVPEQGEPSTERFGAGYVEYTEVGAGITHHIVNRGTAPHHEVLVEFKGPSRAAEHRAQDNGRTGSPTG